MRDIRIFLAGPDDHGRRLDRILRRLLPELSLSLIYRSLRCKQITLNGRRAHPEDRVSEKDTIAIVADLIEAGIREGSTQEYPSNALPELELDALAPYLVQRSNDLLFINKPRGMQSHGPDGLDALVREALSSRSAVSLSFTPGPLHRLDRNTSGLIAFPCSLLGAQKFTACLRQGGLRKRYLALLENSAPIAPQWKNRLLRDHERGVSRVFSEAGPSPEGAAPARASARPLLSSRDFVLAVILLETGLTHQIRAQAAWHGHPLAGDSKYGGRPFNGGYILHAGRLDFLEPLFPDVPLHLSAPLPATVQERLVGIFGENDLNLALAAFFAPGGEP